MRNLRVAGWLDLAVKAALLALLVAAVVRPELSGIKEKAATARLVVYPLGAIAVPVWWIAVRAAGRRQGDAYPWDADLLVTLPWLLDLLGNRLDLFDTVSWWDDAMHFANWFLLTSGVLVAATTRRTGRGSLVMYALGFGATAAVVWELGEYAAFIRHSSELTTAYTDTLGDLTLGTLGALVAALVLLALRRVRRSG